MLWNALWFYNVFLDIFIHYYWPLTSELLYLHQTFTDYVSNQYWYVKMPDVPASYGTPFDFIAFFKVFSYIIDEHSCLNCLIFTKNSYIVTTIHVCSIVFSPIFHRLYDVIFNQYTHFDMFSLLYFIHRSVKFQ